MGEPYPDDADGDALRRVAALGVDMSRSITIDFFVAVPNRNAGEAIAKAAAPCGYRIKVIHDEEHDEWTCYCVKTMRPVYDEIMSSQRELDDLSRLFGGYCDGWGTSGDTLDT